MEQTNRTEAPTQDNQDSRVLEPLAAPESAEPLAVEFDPLPDVPDGDDIELSNWRASVEAYVSTQTQPFTVDDVLEHGMHFTPGGWDRSEQMRCAEILRELGFDRQQRRIDGVRAQYWSSPTMVAFESRASEVSQPAAAEHVAPAPQEDGSIVGDAVDDDASPAPSTPVEPAQPSGPTESASARYQRLSARETEIKAKLRAAKAGLTAAEDARKKAALAAVGGSFKEEAAYYAAVDADKAASAHVEQLTAALAQIGEDLRHAGIEQEAERRVAQCRHIREAARLVEDSGARIEATLAEAGKLINAYLRNVDLIYRRSIPVLSGQPECAMPMTQPMAHAILGHFLRSAKLDPDFFSDMNLRSLLAFESPSQIVSMQLGGITERLLDNSWMALAEPDPHFMAEPIDPAIDPEIRRKRSAWPENHQLVPAGIFPTIRRADAEGEEA